MKNATIHKDSNGKLYLLGPGLLKIEVENKIEDSWNRLEEIHNENLKIFKESGLLDESVGFNMKKAFSRAFWLENLLKGLIIAVPTFVGFTLFAALFINQVTKLSQRLAGALTPTEIQNLNQRKNFKERLELARPYLHEVLRVWSEEQSKIKHLDKRD